MSKLIQQMMAALVMTAVVSAGAFAQGRGKGQDKRPPKPPVKIIDGKGGSKPPPPPEKPPKEKKRP